MITYTVTRKYTITDSVAFIDGVKDVLVSRGMTQAEATSHLADKLEDMPDMLLAFIELFSQSLFNGSSLLLSEVVDREEIIEEKDESP